jgi:hypothetical protein
MVSFSPNRGYTNAGEKFWLLSASVVTARIDALSFQRFFSLSFQQFELTQLELQRF